MDEIFIPEDVFHYLTTFLSPVDCMSFTLSGVSKRFSSYYCSRRRSTWKLRKTFCLDPNICQRYFSSSLVSVSVQTLDLSHCYWLPETSLLGCLSELENLRELNVLDTKLSLSSLILNVIPKCKFLLKLSANISEPTWSDFNQKLLGAPDNYKENFQKFTELNFYVLDSSSPYIWLLLFNIFGWCRDCVQLDLEMFQSGMMRQKCPWEHQDSSIAVIDLSRKNLYDGMKWMMFLKGFSVKSRLSDSCLDDFCHWLLLELCPNSLEKLWLPSVKAVSLSTVEPRPTLRSLYLGRLDAQLCSKLFPQATHLADVRISLDFKLPYLRFLRGNFVSSLALDEFCRDHPQLEHLHFDGQHDCYGVRQDERITFQCQWALARLRSLIFASNPHPDVLIKFMDSCTKLEELHVGRLLTSSIFLAQEPVHEAYRRIAKQQHLKKLSLSGLEFTHGEFLEQIFQNCLCLESLHIAGQFEEDVTFHQDLCKYLPLAKNLRDFRLQKEEISESDLLELITSLSSCQLLERLVISQEMWSAVSPTLSSILPQRLFELASVHLPRLVAFCLAYPLEIETINIVTDQFQRLIVPNRLPFWFHLEDSLPRGTSVPRIHLDEIVDPPEYIDAFPVFIS